MSPPDERPSREHYTGLDEHRKRRVWVFAGDCWVPAHIDHAGRRSFEGPPPGYRKIGRPRTAE